MTIVIFESATYVEVKTECLEMSQIIEKVNTSFHAFGVIIVDENIRSILARDVHFHISHIFRKANQCADLDGVKKF